VAGQRGGQIVGHFQVLQLVWLTELASLANVQRGVQLSQSGSRHLAASTVRATNLL